MCGVLLAVGGGGAMAQAAGAAAGVAGPPGAQARPELPRTHAPEPTTPAITAADLMTRLYIFADDSMQGREAGTPGHVRGTTYIVNELKRLGVKPMGDSGGYYQVVPVAIGALDLPGSKLIVDGTPLVAGKDFHPFPGIEDLPLAMSASVQNARVVFGGRFGASDAIRPADARGKLVVFLPPVGRNGPAWQVFELADTLALYSEAAGLLVASYELTPPQVWGIVGEPNMMLVKPETHVPVVTITRDSAAKLLGTSLDSAKVGGGTKSATLSYSQATVPPAAPARNVVAMVEGSDPQLKAEYVTLSAHSDHLGLDEEVFDHDSLRVADVLTRPLGFESPERPFAPGEAARFKTMLDSVRQLHPARRDSIANGADDDGSGSMGLLELAEYFQTMPLRPKRSILFVWNVAEEKGLFGSEWFTDHPTLPRDSIIADINIDMIGRGAPYDIENGGMNYLQILGSRRLSTEYGNWVEEVNARPEFSFKFDYQFDANGHPQQYYCRSDHWNFARWSIPTVFFSTGSHSDYHMVTDEPQYIDYPHYAKVVNFVAALAADVAARPNRPTVDKPRPDPHGACKQ